MIDDLCFDGEDGRTSADPGADQTHRVADLWMELQRQRHAREVMTVERTTRLALMLSIANRLTALSCDVTHMVLHDDGDESLKLLQCRIEKAERVASDIYRSVEVSHG